MFELLWLFFILTSLQPVITQRLLAARRARALTALERRNRSRAITLIHRQEGLSLLGIRFGGFPSFCDARRPRLPGSILTPARARRPPSAVRP